MLSMVTAAPTFHVVPGAKVKYVIEHKRTRALTLRRRIACTPPET